MSILAQVRREFAAFFHSPIAYVLLLVATVLNGLVFMFIVDFLSDPRSPHGAPMQMLFSWVIFWFIVIVVTPLITMRTLAEEKSSGTLETLLTAPIDEFGVVVAKFLAALGFYLVLWLPTLAYPLVLSRFSEIDLGPILAGYLGAAGVGTMFLSIGILCSALFRSQIVAALLSFAVVMVLFLAPLFSFLDPAITSDSILGYMELISHMEDFSRGIVDSRHLIYYGSVTLFALFCTVQVIQARRWRG